VKLTNGRGLGRSVPSRSGGTTTLHDQGRRGMPDTKNSGLFACQWRLGLQCSRRSNLASQIEKGRRNPAASVSQNIRRAYSAACFRGGSSAPESWISATW
jgi:hypothetical protein